MIKLKGITWNHTRGFLPLVGIAQRLEERNPEICIQWEKRSLQAFADAPIEDLAKQYDLLIIDHPHAGMSAASGALLPLEQILPKEFLADQAAHQVGRSHDTYNYDGHQWALAIDAATPVAFWRPDSLKKLGVSPPQTWDELLEFARTGKVVVPAIPIDSLMNFYSLCVDQNDSLFRSKDQLVEPETGRTALLRLKQLIDLCPSSCLERNPIRIHEALLSESDPAVYCPFAYGYSNYSRPGYAPVPLRYGNVVSGPSGQPFRTTLGGTGLAISAHCQHTEAAAEFARMVAGPEAQAGLFFDYGGQPGHRSAWLDPRTNSAAGDFFSNTLETLDRAYIRPRYHGYMHFQDEGSLVVHAYLSGKADADTTLQALAGLYRESLATDPLVETLSNDRCS